MQSVQPCIVWVYSCIVTLIGTQSDLTLHNVVTFSKASCRHLLIVWV